MRSFLLAGTCSIVACGLSMVGNGSESPDASAVTDAAGDDVASDAMVVDAPPRKPSLPEADPGQVACGDASCPALGQQRCCIVGGGMTCMNHYPDASCDETEIDCDEQSDCDGGACCLGPDDGHTSFWSTLCLGTCLEPDAGARVCKSDAECDGGTPCLPVTCGARRLGTCGGVKPSICP